MSLIIELIYFILLTMLIVLISKYILVTLLRKLAETFNMRPKTVGNISGFATSVPELLTATFSAISGLISASISNILSSNIINTILYTMSILLNKNLKALKNKAIKIDLFLVLITILIPIISIISNTEISIAITPFFFILFFLFYKLNINVHKLYLEKEENIISKKIEKEEKWLKGKTNKAIKYFIYLLLTCILLYIIGNSLSNVLEKLCNEFNISEIFIGILLGFTTSIPEFITFFESQKFYKKKETSVDNIEGVVEATNNLLSSNTLNLFIIQSIGIIIYTVLYYQ